MMRRYSVDFDWSHMHFFHNNINFRGASHTIVIKLSHINLPLKRFRFSGHAILSVGHCHCATVRITY